MAEVIDDLCFSPDRIATICRSAFIYGKPHFLLECIELILIDTARRSAALITNRSADMDKIAYKGHSLPF
jgi:hypothetical protein